MATGSRSDPQRPEPAVYRAASFSRQSIWTCLWLSGQSFCQGRAPLSNGGGFDPNYYFIEDRASGVPYYNYYTPEGIEEKARIYVEDGYAQPRIREISEVSEVVRGLQRGYELHRVCFPAEVKEDVYKLYHRAASLAGAQVSSGD